MTLPKKIKKDFDRDKMYSKIMPTNAQEMEKTEEAPPPDASVTLEPIRESTFEPILELELSVPRMHNFMEDMINEKLPHTMQVLRSCQCERCRLDILAIALNSLPTAYAVTTKDDASERVKNLRREYEVKVTATLIKAIQRVKIAPRH